MYQTLALVNESKETFSFLLFFLQLSKTAGENRQNCVWQEQELQQSTVLQAAFSSKVWNKYKPTNLGWMQNAIKTHCHLADYNGISEIHLKLKPQATVQFVWDKLKMSPAPLSLQSWEGNGSSKSEKSSRPMNNENHSQECNTEPLSPHFNAVSISMGAKPCHLIWRVDATHYLVTGMWFAMWKR